MSQESEKWYYCADCNVYIKSKKEAIEEHRDFGHFIKRRVPISKRIVFRSRKFGEPNILKMKIDGLEWKINLRFVIFKDGEFKYKRVLDLPLKNCVATINHLHQTKFTIKDLKSAIKNAIKNGNFTDYGEGQAKIILYINDKGKLDSITASKLSRLGMKEVKVEIK